MVIAPGCREAAAAAAKYVGEVEKRIYWIVAGDGGGGDRSRHPPSDHYLSPRRSRHGIIRIGLATSGNRGCVCVLWACGCCPAENCVYITEYNRNVIPLVVISPSHIVGTP